MTIPHLLVSFQSHITRIDNKKTNAGSQVQDAQKTCQHPFAPNGSVYPTVSLPWHFVGSLVFLRGDGATQRPKTFCVIA